MEAMLRGPLGQTVLGLTVVTIGSSPGNQLIVNDPKVSAYQAEIRPTDQGYVIIDAGSANETFVNGQRLNWNVPRLLMPGDTLRLGDTTFTYEVLSTPQSGEYASTQQQSYVPPPPPAYGPYDPMQQQSYVPPPPPTVYGPYDPTYTPPATLPAQPYTPIPQQAYTPPPAPAQQGGSAGRKRWGTLLLIGMALLVILAGAAALLVTRNNQIAANNASSTATAQANFRTATVRANITATAIAQANATATFVTNPYPPGAGTLVLYDPLKDNSKGQRWDEATYDNGNARCGFTQGTYQVSESHPFGNIDCIANASNFSNFAYQAEVTILKGDCGGLVFRAVNAQNKYYYFEVCQDGRFSLASNSGSSGEYLIPLTTNAAIKTGLKQKNVIAVVAKGNMIQLFVNNTSVDNITNTAFSQGQIGLLADNYNKGTTQVVFANVKVWTL